MLGPAIAVAEAMRLIEADQLADIDVALKEVLRQVDARDGRRELTEVGMDTLLPAGARHRAAFALEGDADRAALRFTTR
ncbi:hypothetical protein D3C86_1481560 [compost metagenome]